MLLGNCDLIVICYCLSLNPYVATYFLNEFRTPALNMYSLGIEPGALDHKNNINLAATDKTYISN